MLNEPSAEVDPWSRWALSTCNRRSQALPADGIPVPSAVTPTRTRRREQDGSWKGARSWGRLSRLPRASTVPGPFPGVSRRVGSSSTSHLGRAVPHLTADAIPCRRPAHGSPALACMSLGPLLAVHRAVKHSTVQQLTARSSGSLCLVHHGFPRAW